MSEAKHTPGPWHMGRAITRAAGLLKFHEIPLHAGTPASVGNCFATVHLGGPGATDASLEAVEANARLMRAAPSLADFLVELLQGGELGLASPAADKARNLLRQAGRALPEEGAAGAGPAPDAEAAPAEERWCASLYEDDWTKAVFFSTREQAITEGPVALRLTSAGVGFWVGEACTPASGLSADMVLDGLDNHASDEGCPDGTDAYVEGDSYSGSRLALGDEPVAELEALLDSWAAKHDVRPRWFIVEGVTYHKAP